MMKTKLIAMGFICGLTAACSDQSIDSATAESEVKAEVAIEAEAPTIDHTKIVTGNGENNYIMLEGTRRENNQFTIPKVVISQDGFLVVHPFLNDEPVQTEYVGATFVASGQTENVDIEVNTPVNSGDKFVVMLHYDMNKDGIFDFNDGLTVPDVPVFEGHTLVALRYIAP